MVQDRMKLFMAIKRQLTKAEVRNKAAVLKSTNSAPSAAILPLDGCAKPRRKLGCYDTIKSIKSLGDRERIRLNPRPVLPSAN